MRPLLLPLTVTSCLIAAGQVPSTSHAIGIHIPTGWKQIGRLTFERDRPEIVAENAAKDLSSGHQPWRLDAKNIAAECLMEFQLGEGSDVFEISDHLSPGSRPGMFIFSLAGTTVTVTVQAFNHVPVALHLQVDDPCEHPQTTIDMRECAWKKYREADEELNKVYKTLRDRLNDQKRREMLIQAQRDWIKFRDSCADFEAYFYEGGSIKEQIKAYALERITRSRAKELQAIITSEFDH